LPLQRTDNQQTQVLAVKAQVLAVKLDGFFTNDFAGLDYDALHDAFAWVRAMAATPQDPSYHGEGDVWTHTRMVCDAVVADEGWPGLDADGRRVLLLATLLHDAGKPAVTYTEPDGRTRSPGHAVRGATLARRVLWEMEEPFAVREEVAALVRHHMQPRYLPEQRDPRHRTFAISYAARCDRIALLARADARGRIAPDLEESLDRVARFVDLCVRHGCLTGPRAFSSDHARVLYFRRAIEDPDAIVEPPAGPRVTVMSGLPGSGKDSWIARHRSTLPVISLDEIRRELDIAPSAEQRPVVRLARQRAARLLAAGQDFIWNATTLGRQHRRSLCELAAPYDPHLRYVYVDAPPALLFARNRGRASHAVVPTDVIWRMTGIWEPPDLTETHELVRVLHEGQAPDSRRGRTAHEAGSNNHSDWVGPPSNGAGSAPEGTVRDVRRAADLL
jgi:predicted kinase